MQKVTNDTEVTAATLALKDDIRADLPPLATEPFAPELAAERAVLCIAGRSKLDESAALMLAQLLGKHGLNVRVEGAETLSTSGVFQLETKGVHLETKGVAIVFLSYLDTSPAHMRYAIRRLRRKRLRQSSPRVLDGWRRRREFDGASEG